MRFVFMFITLTAFLSSCKTKTTEMGPIEGGRPIKGQNQNSYNTKAGPYNLAVSYEALSRGHYDFILISEKEILTSNDRALKSIKKQPCPEKDWTEISELITSLDREIIPNLIPPTDKRLYDGAPHATLSFIYGDVEIRSPSFDHGHPPKEVEALVSKILAIKEGLLKP